MSIYSDLRTLGKWRRRVFPLNKQATIKPYVSKLNLELASEGKELKCYVDAKEGTITVQRVK